MENIYKIGIALALVLALVGVGLGFANSNNETASFKGTTSDDWTAKSLTASSGDIQHSSEFTNGSSTEATIEVSIAATDTQACWINGTDNGVWIDYAMMGIGQGDSASSTLKLTMVATTSIASTMDFTSWLDVASSSIINVMDFGTSTGETFYNASSTVPIFVSSGNGVCAYKQNGDVSAGFVEAQASGIYSTATSSDQPEIQAMFHYYRD